MTINLWTDGGCHNAHVLRPGAWAFVVARGNAKLFEEFGAHAGTTSNRMEMQAVMRGLRHVCGMTMQGEDVTVYSDSQYVVRGATEWVYNWERRGWRTSAGAPVRNRGLWEKMMLVVDAARARGSVSWHHVKGHSGLEFNERADKLCTKAMRKLMAKVAAVEV